MCVLTIRCQFCLSAPKTQVAFAFDFGRSSFNSARRLWQIENNVIVSDYTQMDRLLKEERQYLVLAAHCLHANVSLTVAVACDRSSISAK